MTKAVSKANIPGTGEDPGVAEFARLCIHAARKTPMTITDLIITTSARENLLYHVGPFEFSHAYREIIKLVRVERPATLFNSNGDGTNRVAKGEHNDLLGDKVFVEIDKGTPQWAGGTEGRKPVNRPPSGRDHPIIRDFLNVRMALLLLGVPDDYSDTWVASKIKAKPAIRDVDLLIATESIRRNHQNIGELRQKDAMILELSAAVARLTQDAHSVAA